MKRKRKVITVDDLKAALASRDSSHQYSVFENYSKQRPLVEALPFLRKALGNRYHAVVTCAADALSKLGEDALPAMPNLLRAAYKTDDLDMPQSYPECLRAMVAIDPENEWILELISHWAGLHNWGVTSTAMAALQQIGTPKAMALLKRIHGFWYSEWSKRERELAAKFLKPLK